MLVRGRRYDTGDAVGLEIEDGRIARMISVEPSARLPYISPGWIDLQVNGYGGQEFSSPRLTVEDVERVVRQCHAFGVTRLCPTVTTNSDDVILHALRTISTASETVPAVQRAVAGIHLEGPYLSAEDGPRGAHPRAYCRPPVWDEFRQFQDAAAERIRLITLSPEYDSAPDFIQRAVQSGVIVAIGHTAANSQQIARAVDAGASISTHLGNGAHLMVPRHPNYIWDQLADDRLSASLIVDGHHLPAAVVKAIVRAKSPERTILISDLSGMAGLPAGRYHTELCDLEILADGRLVIAGQDKLLAAASAPIGNGIGNVMEFAGVNLRQAVDMATIQPARLLSSEALMKTGAPADLTLFEYSTQGRMRVNVVETIAAGESVFHRVD